MAFLANSIKYEFAKFLKISILYLDIFLNMACNSINRIIEIQKLLFTKDEIDWLLNKQII